MSGPAVRGLELEGGLSSLTLQLTKVKSLKTKKLNTLRRTIERFERDQNNLELWKALQSSKEASDDNGDAYEILMEACIAKMQQELEIWERDTVSPLVSKLAVTESDLMPMWRTKTGWSRSTSSLLEASMRGRRQRTLWLLRSHGWSPSLILRRLKVLRPSNRPGFLKTVAKRVSDLGRQSGGLGAGEQLYAF